MSSNSPESTTHDASHQLVGPQAFGHPQGLFYLFFAELWERFSFYGMRALLTLYMVQQVFEALANRDTVSAIVYSSYGSLVYASPLIGGRIADQLNGYRQSIMLGRNTHGDRAFCVSHRKQYRVFFSIWPLSS